MRDSIVSPPNNASDRKHGNFVFSLDTELAWGEFWNGTPHRRTRRRGDVEREGIRRILDLMDAYEVRATWAITGHLFYPLGVPCPDCPIERLRGQDPHFADVWGTDKGLWYGADIVEEILARDAGHEIACHGYTHRYFDSLSPEEARFEIEKWVALAREHGLMPWTVIFPQGRIAHLDLFREAGFLSYRGKDVRQPMLAVPILGKLLNRANLRLAFLRPQVFDPDCDASGLVNIPSSLWMFRTDRRVETTLDALGVPFLRLRGAAHAIRDAARTGKTVHLWAHPHEFRTEEDFRKLAFVFEQFSQEAQAGRLESITMAELARQTAGREC